MNKKTTISFADFQKIDLRIGYVIKAQFLPGSRNLIEMEVDLGEDYGTVTILAGLGDFYHAEELEGKKFIFVANLEPKKMLDKLSNGMILAADDQGKPILLPVDNNLQPGTIVR
jgi:methionine--tRNA ligase beta chain